MENNVIHLSHGIKQIVPVTYSLEKKLFVAATFRKVRQLFLFKKSKKRELYFALFEPFSHFYRQEGYF